MTVCTEEREHRFVLKNRSCFKLEAKVESRIPARVTCWGLAVRKWGVREAGKGSRKNLSMDLLQPEEESFQEVLEQTVPQS